MSFRRFAGAGNHFHRSTAALRGARSASSPVAFSAFSERPRLRQEDTAMMYLRRLEDGGGSEEAGKGRWAMAGHGGRSHFGGKVLGMTVMNVQ